MAHTPRNPVVRTHPVRHRSVPCDGGGSEYGGSDRRARATEEPAEEIRVPLPRKRAASTASHSKACVITVEGNGFEAETETDADGRWEIGVPEKATYEVTLDEDTLPEGVVVAEGSATREAEFGLTRNASR